MSPAQKESPPQGGSCAAQCEAESKAQTDADGMDGQKACEVMCQLKQLPVLGLANSVLAALGDVQVMIGAAR